METEIEEVGLLHFEGETGLFILAWCGGFVYAGGADKMVPLITGGAPAS